MARPIKEIDWDVVDEYIESGSNGIEIAADLRIQPQTFYRRFEEEYGVSFQNYSSEYDGAGRAKLRSMLHRKALNNDENGNQHLLVFLARCRLGMKEPETVHLVAANQEQIDQSHVIMQLQHRIAELEGDKTPKLTCREHIENGYHP